MSLEKVKQFIRDEEGQGMTEYILIVLLIAIVAIAAFKFFGKKVDTSVKDAADRLDEEAADAIDKSKKEY